MRCDAGGTMMHARDEEPRHKQETIMPDESDLVMSQETREAIARFTDGAIEGVPSGDQAIAALIGLMKDNPHLFDYSFRMERAARLTKRVA